MRERQIPRHNSLKFIKAITTWCASFQHVHESRRFSTKATKLAPWIRSNDVDQLAKCWYQSEINIHQAFANKTENCKSFFILSVCLFARSNWKTEFGYGMRSEFHGALNPNPKHFSHLQLIELRSNERKPKTGNQIIIKLIASIDETRFHSSPASTCDDNLSAFCDDNFLLPWRERFQVTY